MNFVCYSDWAQLPASVNKLFEQSEQNNLFCSRPWLESVTDTLEADQILTLACVISDNDIVALLPLVKTSGDYFCSLNHRYATHFSFLLASEQRQNILSCLVHGLTQLPLSALLLEPVAQDDQNIIDLQCALESAGFRCEYLFRHYNWIYRTQNQSFDQYINSRPPRLRNTIARKQRKLQREHGFEIKLHTGKKATDAMQDYYSVYTASWKANEQFTSFVNTIVARFSSSGETRLAIMYVNNQPIAAQLWFVLYNKAYIFRLAYNEAWKKYSPGSILSSYLMQHVMDTDHVQEIDFLTGNDSYKQDWMSERRERFALSCINTTMPSKKTGKLIKFLSNLFRKSE